MPLPHEEIELDHLDRVAWIVLPRHEIAPLAMQIDEREIDEAVDDEHPHHREVPVAGAGEPSAECEPSRDRLMLEWVPAESLAAPRERGVRVEDAEPGPR